MKITQIPTPLLGGPSNGGSVSLKPALGTGPTGPTGGTGPTGPQGPPGPGTGAGAWQPSTAYTANQVVQAPDGSMISRNATGTSRASFDATEQAAWTAVVGKAGTVAASALSDSIAVQVAANNAVAIATTVTDTYTLALADKGKVIEANKATGFTITIPPESSVAWPAQTILEVFQLGTGQVTIAGGVGVSLLAPFGTKTSVQYGSIFLRKRAADTWVVAGDTTT